MAKIKYDNSEVEASNFKQPTPGLYTMTIEEANHRNENGKNDIEIVLVVNGGEFDKSKLWTYVGLSEASAWKFRELTDALGLPAAGELDTNQLVNKKMKVKVIGDQYQGEYRARAGRFAPVDGSAVEVVSSGAEPVAEDASAAAEPETDEPYNTWPLEDLVGAITEDAELSSQLPGLTLEGDDAVTDDDKDYLVGFLEAADAGGLDAYLAENPWDEQGDAPEEKVDYSAMSLDEVKEEIARRGLAVPKGRKPKTALIKILEENDAETEDPFKS